jgi:hypothetical protein
MGAMAVGSLFRFRHFCHTLYSARLAWHQPPSIRTAWPNLASPCPMSRVDKVLL